MAQGHFQEVKALNERRILASANLKNLVSFPKYGRLKLKFVFHQILLWKTEFVPVHHQLMQHKHGTDVLRQHCQFTLTPAICSACNGAGRMVIGERVEDLEASKI